MGFGVITGLELGLMAVVFFRTSATALPSSPNNLSHAIFPSIDCDVAVSTSR